MCIDDSEVVVGVSSFVLDHEETLNKHEDKMTLFPSYCNLTCVTARSVQPLKRCKAMRIERAAASPYQ